MQGGVDAHVTMAAGPVEGGLERLAGFGHGLVLARYVHHLALVLAIDRGGDRDAAAGPVERAGVARLAAAGRVEHRTVEDDAAAVVDRNNLGLGLADIWVVAEQQLSRHCDRTALPRWVMLESS